jgi:hypothetical protein
VADSYVNSASPTTNYGTATTFRVDGSPDVHSYLRFDVSGVSGTISRAVLRIYANSSGTAGIQAWSIADNTWSETAINYNNAPPLPALPASSSGAFGTGVWVELDVTSLVTGNSTVSFAVTTPGATAISLASRNASANQPVLVITAN